MRDRPLPAASPASVTSNSSITGGIAWSDKPLTFKIIRLLVRLFYRSLFLGLLIAMGDDFMLHCDHQKPFASWHWAGRYVRGPITCQDGATGQGKIRRYAPPSYIFRTDPCPTSHPKCRSQHYCRCRKVHGSKRSELVHATGLQKTMWRAYRGLSSGGSLVRYTIITTGCIF